MSGILSRIFKPRKRRGKGLPFCSALVLAAGSSQRMEGINKIFAGLGDIPVLIHSLLALNDSEYVDEIILVSRSEDLTEAAGLCRDFNISKVKKVVVGGDTRVKSTLKGLAEISKGAEYVLVHDGARPFISQNLIRNTILQAFSSGGAVCGTPLSDTVKLVKSGQVMGTKDRSELYAVQTPQVFSAQLLQAALQNVINKGLEVTDDCAALEHMGVYPALVVGEYSNIKITTPSDLIFANALYEAGWRRP